MKSILYVNGCSHSCGAEISYVGSMREPKDLETCWAGQLADRFNLIHLNDAVSGNSNETILSTSINSILKLLEEHDPREIMVIIGWSSFERTDFIYDGVRYRFVPGCQELDYFKNWPKVVKKAFDNWIISTDPYNESMNSFSLTYYAMRNFLKLHQLDYYFFNAVNHVHMPAINLLHELTNYIPNHKLFNLMQFDNNYLNPFDKESCYYQYMKARYDGHVDGRNHHFLADAQTEWANILQEKIKNKLK